MRIGELRVSAFHNARRSFFIGIANEEYNIVLVTQKHGSRAIKLLVKHATKRGLRTLDALQLAIALELKSRNLLDQFVSADAKLDGVAKLEKIKFVNPEKF